MKRYVVSPEAQQDLREFREYLITEASLSVSRHVMRAISAALQLIPATPGVGNLRQDLTDEPVKFWQVFSCLIVYDQLARPIGIAQVLHSSRDIEAILAEDQRMTDPPEQPPSATPPYAAP